MNSHDSNWCATLRRSDSESCAAETVDIDSADDNDEADAPTIMAVWGEVEDGTAHVCTMRSMAKSAESTLSLAALFNSDSATKKSCNRNFKNEFVFIHRKFHVEISKHAKHETPKAHTRNIPPRFSTQPTTAARTRSLSDARPNDDDTDDDGKDDDADDDDDDDDEEDEDAGISGTVDDGSVVTVA